MIESVERRKEALRINGAERFVSVFVVAIEANDGRVTQHAAVNRGVDPGHGRQTRRQLGRGIRLWNRRRLVVKAIHFRVGFDLLGEDHEDGEEFAGHAAAQWVENCMKWMRSYHHIMDNNLFLKGSGVSERCERTIERGGAREQGSTNE